MSEVRVVTPSEIKSVGATHDDLAATPAKVERHTLILRDIDQNAEEEIKKLFNNSNSKGEKCPNFSSLRYDLNSWFVTFHKEEDAKRALEWLKDCTLHGAPVRGRIKTESMPVAKKAENVSAGNAGAPSADKPEGGNPPPMNAVPLPFYSFPMHGMMQAPYLYGNPPFNQNGMVPGPMPGPNGFPHQPPQPGQGIPPPYMQGFYYPRQMFPPGGQPFPMAPGVVPFMGMPGMPPGAMTGMPGVPRPFPMMGGRGMNKGGRQIHNRPPMVAVDGSNDNSSVPSESTENSANSPGGSPSNRNQYRNMNGGRQMRYNNQYGGRFQQQGQMPYYQQPMPVATPSDAQQQPPVAAENTTNSEISDKKNGQQQRNFNDKRNGNQGGNKFNKQQNNGGNKKNGAAVKKDNKASVKTYSLETDFPSLNVSDEADGTLPEHDVVFGADYAGALLKKKAAHVEEPVQAPAVAAPEVVVHAPAPVVREEPVSFGHSSSASTVPQSTIANVPVSGGSDEYTFGAFDSSADASSAADKSREDSLLTGDNAQGNSRRSFLDAVKSKK